MATPATVDKRFPHRVRPRAVVSVAIHQGERLPPAYAIVSDISEHGVCVISDRILVQGQSLQLRIQFPREKDLFEANGRVAWTRPFERGKSTYGAAITGIELWLPSREAEHRLRRVLVAPEFEARAANREFDDFIASLRPYLERLGDSLVQRKPRSFC